jgi:hypothetical protein
MKIKKLYLVVLFLVTVTSYAQDDLVLESFSGTRVLSNHSVELLPKRTLEFIVAHKFGDIAGDNGGAASFYGLDNLADVRIAFEYGVLDKFNDYWMDLLSSKFCIKKKLECQLTWFLLAHLFCLTKRR